MDRIEKVIEYLDDSIAHFMTLENLRDAKDGYFDSVVNFKKSIIPQLRKFNIFGENEIADLEKSLDELLLNKNKGGNNQNVYHSTWPKHGIVVAKLSELKATAFEIRLPAWQGLLDFFRFNKRDLIIGLIFLVLGAVITLIIQILF